MTRPAVAYRNGAKDFHEKGPGSLEPVCRLASCRQLSVSLRSCETQESTRPQT